MTYLLIVNTVLLVALIIVDVRSKGTFVQSSTAGALMGSWVLGTSASWVIWAGTRAWEVLP